MYSNYVYVASSYFAHFSAIVEAGYKSLKKGQRVSFTWTEVVKANKHPTYKKLLTLAELKSTQVRIFNLTLK